MSAVRPLSRQERALASKDLAHEADVDRVLHEQARKRWVVSTHLRQVEAPCVALIADARGALARAVGG
jgi:hypothetical protein